MAKENFTTPQKDEFDKKSTSVDYNSVPIHPGALRRMREDLQYLFSVLPKKGAYENFRNIQKKIQEESKNESRQSTKIEKKQNNTPLDEIPRDEQTFRIANSAIKLLNFYYRDKDGSPTRRTQEMDDKGNSLFSIEHPMQVAALCFLNLPLEESEFKNITETEKTILTEAHSKPYELAVTAFFHDFVEDIFDGEFDTEHRITGRTARQEIVDFLQDPKHDIPLDAQQRILERIRILTKPPQRNSSQEGYIPCKEKTECYLRHYEEYLQNIIDSHDPLCQYIKLIDILQNAQSQKKDDPKRKGKASLQANFIKKLFPSFITKLLTEKPQFFDDMSDRNLVEGLQKIAELQKNIQNKVNNTLKEE